MYRNEIKYEIKHDDNLRLSHVLRQVLKHDKHAINGMYHVRSVYFDDIYDRSLQQNQMGLAKRSKYRIRMYNFNADFLLLERKSKNYHKGRKEHLRLTKDEVQMILDGNVGFLEGNTYELAQEFMRDVKMNQLRPMIIIDYEREAFQFPSGNVRVTIDRKIQTSINTSMFFDKDLVCLPKWGVQNLLEIKYDRFIPDFIQASINHFDPARIAHSKYVLGRMSQI